MVQADAKALLKRRRELTHCRGAFIKQTGEPIQYRNSIDELLYKIDTELDDFINHYFYPVGKWLMQIKGVTIEIAAGILAYFSIDEVNCAAQFISFIGLDNHNKPHNRNAREFINMAVNNFITLKEESYYYRVMMDSFSTINERAINYISKVFVAHIFEEMYREEHHCPPERDDRDGNYIIEPEVPYTI